MNKEQVKYWTSQLLNVDHRKGYYSPSQEIWDQAEGKDHAFVQTFETLISTNGTSKVLREYNPNIRIVSVELAELTYVSQGKNGSYGIDSR